MKIESITFPRIGETPRNPRESHNWNFRSFEVSQVIHAHHDLRIPDHVNYSLKRARNAEADENA